jgi:hypothetical protein
MASEYRKMLESIPPGAWERVTIEGALIAHALGARVAGWEPPAWEGHTLAMSALMEAVPLMLDEIERLHRTVARLEHGAEEAECVRMCLDERKVPGVHQDMALSLWGRVEAYADTKPRP